MSFTVYRSSAGSGKTFTLVREYIKILLLKPSDFRHILAITFTNKAANEMKERVLKALTALAHDPANPGNSISSTLLPLLVRETGLNPSEIARNAAQALELILHNYADFSIGTIDGFFHKLIRTFAHDFGLPVNFNVELDSDELLYTAVDLLLERVGDDRGLTSLLVNFLETRMEDDKGWKIDEALAGFAKLLMEEEGQAEVKKLSHLSLDHFKAIATTLYSMIREFEKNIRDIAIPAAQLIHGHNIPPDAFFQGKNGIGKYFENLASGKIDKLEPNSYVKKTVEENKWFSEKSDVAVRDEIDAISGQLGDIFEKLQNETRLHKETYFLRKLLIKTIYPLSVLNEIEKTLSEFKRQNNLVHISEFNSRIARIVMNEPVPFIYERLGEKYHHILIDEFQDTSVLQWMNFIPLIENALAGGYFNLVVGDGKQAIYRWRNGDVEQFNALPSIRGSEKDRVLNQREKALVRNFQSVALNTNYRSRDSIVGFNNRFFRIIADRVLTAGKEKIYKGLEQLPGSGKPGGYVRMELLRGDVDADGAGYELTTLERVNSLIREASQEQFSYSDMAILCRSNHHASLIARFLLEQGVNVVSSESLLVAQSLKVRFIIACLRFLFEPHNDIVLAEISMFIENNTGETFENEPVRKEEFITLPIYDLCEALIRKYNLNKQPDAYLQFFLDAVLKFSVKISSGSLDFLDWWEKKKNSLSVVVSDGMDAVKVMTIHKAKGLQFPMVILPFARDTLKNTRKYLWVGLDPSVAPGLDTAILPGVKEMEATPFSHLLVDEQQKSMLDLVNILYVAMTRPEERLYILTGFPPKNSKEPNSLPTFFDFFLKNEGLWAENQSQYEFGKRENHLPGRKSETLTTVQSGPVISNDWSKTIKIRLRAPEMWDMDQPNAKSQWGTRAHTLLSWIKTARDVPVALEKGILTGLIEKGDVEKTGELLGSVIRNPELQRFFSEEVVVKTEAEILTPEGTFYRPDRVIFDGDCVTVIDYKTGNPRKSHAGQLINYASHLASMGYNRIDRMLIYLGPEIKIVNV